MPAANRLSFLPAASVTGLALATLLASAHPADAQNYSYHEITNTEIGTPTLSPDDSYMDAYGITNAGVVIGTVTVPSSAYPGPGAVEGYQYDTHSGAATLTNYQASSGGPGFLGVSGDGSKILGYYNPGGTGSAVYFTDSNGSITDLPAPYGLPSDGFPKHFAFYAGINSSGATVGVYDDGTENRLRSGFLRNPDGTFTSLTEPDATTSNPNINHGTEALGINASGTIVGGYPFDFVTQSDGRLFPQDNGFILSADGTYTSFIFPGNLPSALRGISDNGNLFGTYLDNPTEFILANFVDVNGSIITGINVPGSLDGSTTLTGINDSGQISGYFYDTDGVSHGFYADPVPEASTTVSFGLLLSLGLGGLVIAGKKSRRGAGAKP